MKWKSKKDKYLVFIYIHTTEKILPTLINNNQLKRHTNPKIKWNSLKSDILIVRTFNTLDFPENINKSLYFYVCNSFCILHLQNHYRKKIQC